MSEAEELVERYLDHFAAGDLRAAADLLSPDVVLVFPGGAPRTSLREVAAEVDRLYESVHKRIHRRWTSATPEGLMVVVTGHLHGRTRSGRGFDGVRFVDWFTVRDGRIAAHEVLNDAAVLGIVPAIGRQDPPQTVDS